jgi:SAM-dependent methyltransferase
MGTPWDRAASGYLEQWVPRFVPYHLDLVDELAPRPGERALITSAGLGAEVILMARAVGPDGFVRATDENPEMVRLCLEQVDRAGLPTRIDCAEGDASDASGGPWDAVVCAFGFWQLLSRERALRAWRDALAPRGKIGILTWGPIEPAEPFAMLSAILREVEPDSVEPDAQGDAKRDAMASLFEDAGLIMVRHTVVRHTLSFCTAEAFLRALRETCSWQRLWEALGDARLQRVATRFYEACGGPDLPLSFDPPATLAIAALRSA